MCVNGRIQAHLSISEQKNKDARANAAMESLKSREKCPLFVSFLGNSKLELGIKDCVSVRVNKFLIERNAFEFDNLMKSHSMHSTA